MQRPGGGTRVDVPSIPGVVDLTLIGRGGSSLIYRGRQQSLSRDVAVKVLATPPATPEALSRWKRGLDAMGRLSNHPNIVDVYDSGLTEDERPYLVMPYVAGGTLGDRVRDSGPLPADEAVVIGSKIARALSAAHAAGVLHRDVKPDNVLLSPYEPLLADFGIARLLDTTTTAATAVGLVHATLNYAAPEVLAGDPASVASDVYGLAATLHTALTGTVPFPHARDANAIAVAHRIIHDPVPSLDGRAPAALADAIAAGMAKDPADRFASADAFADALESSLTQSNATRVAPVATRTETLTRTEALTRAETIPAVDRPRATAPRTGRGLLVATGLVALVAVLAFLAWPSEKEPSTPNAGAPSTTAAPVASETTVRRAQPAATGAVATAAQQYFTKLSNGDYGGAYGMLSPAFRAQQSRDSFENFWRSAGPVSIAGTVTAEGLTARVPIQMGSRAHTYTLLFSREGTRLWVDGPRPR